MSKKFGRPATPDYTKKQYRYSGIEKRFLQALDKMQNENDKKVVLEVLESMKIS